MLTTLGLPEEPHDLLAEQPQALDNAYHQVGARLAEAANDVTLDTDGRLHVAALVAVPEPPSLIELRDQVEVMLPHVDLPEVVLEVMG